jgi:hypothetical protein
MEIAITLEQARATVVLMEGDIAAYHNHLASAVEDGKFEYATELLKKLRAKQSTATSFRKAIRETEENPSLRHNNLRAQVLMHDALQVIAQTEHIKGYLGQNDAKALRQVQDALHALT